MNSPQYDNNLLRQYLLGGLSEVQVEAFDELSIIDDEFASQLGEVENDLIDAYVQGEIHGTTRTQFEARYLTSPRHREKVHFAQALQIFAETKVKASPLEAIEATSPVAETGPTKSEPLRPTILAAPWWQRWFAVPNLRLQLGLAAMALLLLFGGGWFYLENARLHDQAAKAEIERAALQQRERELQAQLATQQTQAAKEREQLEQEMQRTKDKLAQIERQPTLQQRTPSLALIVPKIASFTLAPLVRGGASKTQTLTITTEIEYVVLTLKLGTDTTPTYRAELHTLPTREIVWSSGELKNRSRNGNRVVTVRIPANRLTTGEYNLTLKRVAAPSELIRDYFFQVVKP